MTEAILTREGLMLLASRLWKKHRICWNELSELAAFAFLPVSQENSQRIVALLSEVHRAVVSSACAPPGHRAPRR